jgi:mono/diheme cytochrome c family protein
MVFSVYSVKEDPMPLHYLEAAISSQVQDPHFGRANSKTYRGAKPAIVGGILLALILIGVTAEREALASEGMTPIERAANTPKGELKNPYTDFTKVAEEGHRKYMAAGCNGCHGGGGGGGMAAPLTNPVWIYGKDDDTLFRLITLGTGSLSPGNAFDKLGYRRKGSEAVVGPMPPFGDIIKSDDDLWKIIAWIRSVNCELRASGC